MTSHSLAPYGLQLCSALPVFGKLMIIFSSYFELLHILNSCNHLRSLLCLPLYLFYFHPLPQISHHP